MKGRDLPRPPRKLILWGLRKPYYGSQFTLRVGMEAGQRPGPSHREHPSLLGTDPSLSPSSADRALALCKEGHLFLSCSSWLLFASFPSLGQFPERLTSPEVGSHL